MKKINLFVLSAVSAVILAACNPAVEVVKQYDGTEVQGVTAEKILIGNTAATSGAFATVGVPFNAGINAVLKNFNDAGGFDGATVELVHYDDSFDGAIGLAATQKLVEQDKVFALVGHFGTNTVAATVDYIKDQGIPMVYAATGISDLYQEAAEGFNKAVMPVQPIYNSEGRMMLARALADDAVSGLNATKIGVISTTDDAGEGMLYGVQKQAELLSVAAKENLVYVTTPAEQGTNHSAPVNTLKTAGCDVVIVAANQVPFTEILNYMRDANFNTKVITSYVTANTDILRAAAAAGSITADRPVFTNSWLDVTDLAYYDATLNPYALTPEYVAYLTEMNTGGQVAYSGSSYAIAGYVAAKIFLEGLARVKAADKELTWLNYINAMEEDPVDLPMGSEIDYADGKRLGVTDLGFSKLYLADPVNTSALAEVDTLRTLDYVWALVPAAKKA